MEERLRTSPLVLLPEKPQYGILSEKTAVVKHPDFNYHLTKILFVCHGSP